MNLVSIIIPAYNEEKYIGKCLESLQKQSYKKTEIIVVDDGSSDNTKKIVKKFKRVLLLEGEHKGPGSSRNLGVRNCNGNIVVFVDADMTFDKDYVRNLVTPLIEDKNLLGTTHDFEIATNTSNIYSRLWGKVRVSKNHAPKVNIFRAIRREKFLELGGFDQKYGYADDQTLYYKYGLRPVVAKDTTCYHRNPESLSETYKQAVWIGRSWKERFSVLKVPFVRYCALATIILITPLKILTKSMQASLLDKSVPVGKSFSFFTVKFLGYLKGVITSVLFNEVRK